MNITPRPIVHATSGMQSWFRARASLMAFAVILAPRLTILPAHAEAASTTTTGWSICAPFEKAADAQKRISRHAYEKIVGEFKQPAKEPVPAKNAAAIYISAMVPNRVELMAWQWKGIRKSIDNIFIEKILAYTMDVDVNNDGLTETVIEFVPLLDLAPFNYVLDEHGKLSQEFLATNGRPEDIDGKLVVFENKTYLLTTWGTPTNMNGQPTRQVMDVYRPQKNPMRAKGGIAQHGAGPLCEFTIINK